MLLSIYILIKNTNTPFKLQPHKMWFKKKKKKKKKGGKKNDQNIPLNLKNDQNTP